MSNRATELNINLYSDHTHPVTVRLYRERISTDAATVISEPRPSWLDNVECVARYELHRLETYAWVNVCGVIVKRHNHSNRKPFSVAGIRYGYEDAVRQVVATAEGGGR